MMSSNGLFCPTNRSNVRLRDELNEFNWLKFLSLSTTRTVALFTCCSSRDWCDSRQLMQPATLPFENVKITFCACCSNSTLIDRIRQSVTSCYERKKVGVTVCQFYFIQISDWWLVVTQRAGDELLQTFLYFAFFKKNFWPYCPALTHGYSTHYHITQRKAANPPNWEAWTGESLVVLLKENYLNV